MTVKSYKSSDIITLAHGSGGKAMHELIESMFIAHFDNPLQQQGEDQARIPVEQLARHGDRLAFTTDSYVVDPIFFPGGDIGKLAVTGTVNDLAVGGATPLYLSCAFIIEEGLPMQTLQKVVQSMSETAKEAGVAIVTGDTKVVHRGACDKLFINTAGIGVIDKNVDVSASNALPTDCILINGYLGNHGAAILDARGELALDNTIASDCQTLNDLIDKMLEVCPDIHCMRDATRGGLATVLNEFAQASDCCIQIDESSLPVRTEVRGMCEILGLDPLYLANEGKLVVVVPEHKAQALLECMQAHPAGKDSAIIGRISAKPQQRVMMNTQFGSQRMVDVLIGEQLPRIC